MLTRWRLIELALGKDEAGRVDTAIPQGVFDKMTESAKQDVAGWYYAPEVRMFGRLLSQTECWKQIQHKLERGDLELYIGGTDVTFVARDWPCLRKHVERGEIEVRA